MFLKDIKSALLAYTQTIRKWNRFIADKENLSGLDRSLNQPQQSLKTKPNLEQGP